MKVPTALVLLSLAGFLLPAASPHPAPEPRGPIVAFGDSYTAGFGASANESYPIVLAANLGLAVLNKGVSGETANESLARLHRDVLSLEPELVIVEFGANEAFRSQSVSTCLEALEQILAALRGAGIQVVLVGVHVFAFQENFDEALRALAQRHDAALVLDVLDGVLHDPQLSDEAGYHPNGPGYRIMESRIRPEVERLLAGGPGLAPEGS